MCTYYQWAGSISNPPFFCEKVIIFTCSGHGLLDLTGYEKFMAGELTDYALPEEDLQASLLPISDHPKQKKSGR